MGYFVRVTNPDPEAGKCDHATPAETSNPSVSN
jgi:hypothetical protein